MKPWVATNQITIVIGILAAQLINYVIAETIPPGMSEELLISSWNCQEGWRWMFAATAVPSMIFLLSMFFVPESPRWLVKNGNEEEAGRIVAKLAAGNMRTLRYERFASRSLMKSRRSTSANCSIQG